MQRISTPKIDRIRELRRTGHSIPEIKRIVGCGSGTAFRYAHAVRVDEKFIGALRIKQGGSVMRSKFEWDKAKARSADLIGKLSSRDKIMILTALYWGEGTKQELNIINGDSSLLRVFTTCLQEIGISKERFRISLRLFEDIDENSAKRFWSKELGVKPEVIRASEFSKGKRNGKFPFGMCRIRVQKSAPYFKLIMSMIESIKSEMSPRKKILRGRHSEK